MSDLSIHHNIFIKLWQSILSPISDKLVIELVNRNVQNGFLKNLPAIFLVIRLEIIFVLPQKAFELFVRYGWYLLVLDLLRFWREIFHFFRAWWSLLVLDSLI